MWSQRVQGVKDSRIRVKGYGRKTTLGYIRMLYISYGSVCELETPILLAGDLGFIEKCELGTAKKDLLVRQRSLADYRPLQNAHILPCMLCFFIGLRLALEPDLRF